MSLIKIENIKIKQMDNSDIEIYKNNIVNFLFENSKMLNYEKTSIKDLSGYVRDGKPIVIGAFHDKKIVGFLMSYSYPFREDSNRLYISIIHVLNEYRNIHIGEELLSHIEKIAKNKGFTRLFLHTEATNEKMCNFYEKNGFTRERVQYVKSIENGISSSKMEEVLDGDVCTLIKYRNQFINLYYDNIKVHEYESAFSYKDAEKKIADLQDYLINKKAHFFYTKSDEIITSFMWVHPIKYEGLNRIYIHAYVTKKSFQGNGLAKSLYEHLFAFPFDEEKIYTHVDYSNVVSCHVQEKYGFVPEIIQFKKNVFDI